MRHTILLPMLWVACSADKLQTEGMNPGECIDSADNDGDGDYDCDDSDCFGSPDCTDIDDTGSDDTGFDDTGSDDTGSNDTGSDDTGSDDTGSDDTGSDDTGSDDTGDQSDVDHKIIAYFAEWGVYGRDYQIEDIPTDQVTHVMYAFSNPTESGECEVYDTWASLELNGGSLYNLENLKVANPNIKTLISLGGWTLSSHFSAIAADPVQRESFIDSCVDFMLAYGFDGIDVDWEYPVGGGLYPGVPEDKENYTLLLSEFRTRLDQIGSDYLLTIAAPAGATTIPNMDIPNLAEHLDWINVMTYDFHGPWEATTNHHSPMYSNSAQPDENTVETAIQTYLDSGVPPEKLILGVPFYGKTWSGVTGGSGLFEAASDIGPGNYEAGTMDYHHIVDVYLSNSSFTRYWDSEAQVPYLHSETEGIFISYEDPESLEVKMDFILEKGLGGAMFWELSGDTSTQSLGSVLSDRLLE
jgi:chitinase